MPSQMGNIWTAIRLRLSETLGVPQENIYRVRQMALRGFETFPVPHVIVVWPETPVSEEWSGINRVCYTPEITFHYVDQMEDNFDNEGAFEEIMMRLRTDLYSKGLISSDDRQVAQVLQVSMPDASENNPANIAFYRKKLTWLACGITAKILYGSVFHPGRVYTNE